MNATINATMGTWTTRDGYTITATRQHLTHVVMTDSNGESRTETNDAWLARLDEMKDNGMYKA